VTLNKKSQHLQQLAEQYKKTKSNDDFDKLYPPLYNFFSWMYHQVIHGESQYEDDVIQISCIKVWRKIHQYDPDKTKFVTWARTIIYNDYRVLWNKENTVNTKARRWKENSWKGEVDEPNDDIKMCDDDIMDYLNLLDEPRRSLVIDKVVNGIRDKPYLFANYGRAFYQYESLAKEINRKRKIRNRT